MTESTESLLRFIPGGNSKLDKDIWSFSLPAGWSCPGAKTCMTKVDPETGKIIDGAYQKFRCFAAVDEVRPNVREIRWRNFRLLIEANTVEGMTDLIIKSFPRNVSKMRVHVSGDFFNQNYFDAWMMASRHFNKCKFYAYTKSLNLVQKSLDAGGIPDNFAITLSEGGAWDSKIDMLRTIAEDMQQGLGKSKVVFHPDEAAALNLPIDHDDSHAQSGDHEFALLLHSIQPASSDAAEAVKLMKRQGIKFSYGK
jgi:hypothetical protein